MNYFLERQIGFPLSESAQRAVETDERIKEVLKYRGHDNVEIYDTLNSLNQNQKEELRAKLMGGYELSDAIKLVFTSKREEARHAS